MIYPDNYVYTEAYIICINTTVMTVEARLQQSHFFIISQGLCFIFCNNYFCWHHTIKHLFYLIFLMMDFIVDIMHNVSHACRLKETDEFYWLT